MQRYSLIHTKLPREFVLLQGTGCRWRQCTFCDYHTDTTLRRDESLAQWFISDVYPTLHDAEGIEVLIGNTDLGVGE